MSKPKHPVRETRAAAKRREAKERRLAEQATDEPAGPIDVQSLAGQSTVLERLSV
ncbi:MAG: hypothetical protein K9M08_08475 [Pirellula sp.]|nr:hypothetical protein [Pirellula sp.]